MNEATLPARARPHRPAARLLRSAAACVLACVAVSAQAAMKAVPLGQAAAQRMLARLAGAIPAVVDAALVLPDADRQAYTPMLAILSARHEAQYSRLFRS